MDGRIAQAKEKLDQALKDAADAAAELQRLKPEHKGVPHYSVIEQEAHESGLRLSRLIQQQRAGDVAAEAGSQAPCPECRKLCEVTCQTRAIKSVDGEVELIEAKARCPRCERDFFPSAGHFGI